MTSRFTIRQVDSDDALRIWQSSPNASVFTHPYVATRLAHTVEWYAAIKGTEIFVIWPVALDREGHAVVPHFSYYFGPYWSEVAVNRATTSRLTDRLGAYDGLVTEIVHQHGSIRAELHHTIHDVRPFSWWNYHESNQPKFTIEPRFTAQLTGLEDTSDQDLFLNLRELRRREIRKIEQVGSPVVVAEVNVDQLSHLYRMTFERQGVEAPIDYVEVLAQLLHLTRAGFGNCLAALNEDGEVGSVVLCLESRTTTNMVLNLTSSAMRSSGLGPWTIFQSILQAKRTGHSCYDFNGANSPQRGDDKHSFGAREILYFALSYGETTLAQE